MTAPATEWWDLVVRGGGPAGTRAAGHLTDQRRYDTPAVRAWPEFSPTQAQEWIDGGDVPELARIHSLELVDIDSGHWPMFTAPKALAELLAAASGPTT